MFPSCGVVLEQAVISSVVISSVARISFFILFPPFLFLFILFFDNISYPFIYRIFDIKKALENSTSLGLLIIYII